MPRQVWGESPEALPDRYRALLTPEAVGAAVSDQLSRLELSALTLQVLDGRFFKLASGNDFTNWRIESGTASLVPLEDAVRLDYRLRSNADRPIALLHDFGLPGGVPASANHHLVLPIRAHRR